MFKDKRLQTALEAAEKKFYGEGKKPLNFWQKNARLNMIALHNRKARRIPCASFDNKRMHYVKKMSTPARAKHPQGQAAVPLEDSRL